jgi:hypothetical protein
VSLLPVRFLRILDPGTFLTNFVSIDWIDLIYEEDLSGFTRIITDNGQVYGADAQWEELIAIRDRMRIGLTPTERKTRMCQLEFPADSGRIAPFDPTMVQAVEAISGFPAYCTIRAGSSAFQSNTTPELAVTLLQTASD